MLSFGCHETEGAAAGRCAVKLLLVEDDPETVRLLKQGLGEQGYIVDNFKNGAEGLEAAQSRDYDLIGELTDVGERMPARPANPFPIVNISTSRPTSQHI